VNGICGCGLPASCCQPAVAGGFIYADLWSELNTHLAPQALFTQSSVRKPLLQALPFPSTLGEVTLHPLSQASVSIYSSHGKWFFHPLLWSFPPTVTFTSFPTPDCLGVLLLLSAGMFVYRSCGKWVFPLSCAVFLPRPLSQLFPLLVAGRVLLLLPSPAWLVYLQFWEGFPSPLFSAQGAPPSLPCVFIVLIAYYSVSLFSPGGGRSVQGAVLIWPRVVCGSTTSRLAHLVVCVFPSHLGAGVWLRPGSPPGFSVQCDVEMLCAGWRCGGVKVLPLLTGLACEVCLQHLSKISL
jgi:hypothetical protein